MWLNIKVTQLVTWGKTNRKMRGGGCFAEVTTLFRKNSSNFPVHLFSEDHR